MAFSHPLDLQSPMKGLLRRENETWATKTINLNKILDSCSHFCVKRCIAKSVQGIKREERTHGRVSWVETAKTAGKTI
jgi:hypothetical protein